MKRSIPSVFPPIADKPVDKHAEMVGMLVWLSAASCAIFSAVAELLHCFGWHIPYVICLSSGLFLGIAIGALCAGAFTKRFRS